MTNFTARDTKQIDPPTQEIAAQHLRNPLTRVSPKCPQHHTHLQQVALGLPDGRLGGSGC